MYSREVVDNIVAFGVRCCYYMKSTTNFRETAVKSELRKACKLTNFTKCSRGKDGCVTVVVGNVTIGCAQGQRWNKGCTWKDDI